jgi:aminopeptidase N
MPTVRTLLKFLYFTLALVLISLPLAAIAQESAQSARKLGAKPLPPKRYAPNREFDMRHIALDLQFDWEREQVRGTATLTFAPLTTDLLKVEFDAANMTIASTKLSSGIDLQFETDTVREKLRITLDRVYQPADVVTVVIAYNTKGPTTASTVGLGGLTFIKPTADEPKRPRQIWSQGESEWNHDWFPCFDYPNDFATSELRATVDKQYTVISNGRLMEKKQRDDGRMTFHWKMEEPHASYLTSIVVGEFATVEQTYKGIPITSYVYANQVEEAKVTVARVPEMMKFFEERTGVKYPNAKYAQTFVHGLGGGMENITATTMSDQTIHDLRWTLDRTEDGLLSHELAHSWFGNSVTCRSWSDLWLNEGFATYLSGLWNEHRLGRDDFLYLNIKGDHDGYLNAWSKGVKRPIVTRNYYDPDALFDLYSYARGGSVLHMLRTWLGEERWWRALNHYLRKHAHKPVETEELRIAIEEATGQPFEWFFEQWVYRMGHPVFRVIQSYDPRAKSLTLKVRQEQQVDPENAYPQVKFFETPIDIEIGTEKGTRVERVLIEPREEQSIVFAVDSEPLLVNFDYGDTVIDELVFDKSTVELIYQLRNDGDVMGRLWALDQLAARRRKTGATETEQKQIVDELSVALTNDKFWGVRTDAARLLGDIQGDDARAALLVAVKDQDARVRTAAVTSLAKRNDPSIADVFIQMLADRSYATTRAAALALGATKSKKAYDALRKLTFIDSWRDNIRASALNGLALLGDARALDLGLLYSKPDNTKEVRLAALALLGTVGRDDPRVFPIMSEAFIRAVSSGSTSATDAAAKALVDLGDPRAIQVFQQSRNITKRPEFQYLIGQFEQQLRLKRASQ